MRVCAGLVPAEDHHLPHGTVHQMLAQEERRNWGSRRRAEDLMHKTGLKGKVRKA